ncbi:MAG: sulfatase-like hydrolase/transferase [Verrucomicrobiales bacterium]|nr:sulfatase-like hydrolase/transferase [Verrucomicrobiales bacterium]
MTNPTRTLFLIAVTFLASSLHAKDWIHLSPPEGSANGRTIVFVTGDDEYKSEESMPMMAHILAERHGFDCKVLFAINRKTGVIDTNQRDHIPGLEALEDADLMVIFTRFRALEEAQMQMIEDYLATGKPVIGIRTSTHAFDFSKAPESAFSHYSYSHESGGFGRKVLGQNWIRHWGRHGTESSRGRFAPGMEKHPILTGIEDGEIWGPTDVYEATLPQPDGCEAILLGEVCESMESDSGPTPAPPANAKGRAAINKNDPMMPIAWTYLRDVGAKGRVFTSTIGGAMKGRDDWANEGMRRMFVNACYWVLGMEDQIPEKADVTPVLEPNPFKRGVKPEEALKEGLAKLAEGKDTILFYGNSMVERLLEDGELEARLQLAQPDAGLKIRSLAWTGDEVGNRLRLEGYAKHMKNLLSEWPAKTIVLGYGLNESFAGEAGLADFRQHYRDHLTQLTRLHPGAAFVLLSPIAIEGASEERDRDVKMYRDAIAQLAAAEGAGFVDLYELTRQAYTDTEAPLTNNGIHLNAEGNRFVAKTLAEEIGLVRGLSAATLTEPESDRLHEVALAAAAKHRRVAEVVRPKNAVVYFGVRARPAEYADEMPRYHEMIRLTEAVVHELARDPKLTFAEVPEPGLPPMPEGRGRDDGDRTGIIKTVAESMAEFTTAPGYEVSLFASEEEFPELRNPVQIAFDARGRLWVVTMPSFPHTVPGLTPPDKILIFEDTDRDGKADKVTTFAEGLDALDGVAFHHDGVIISEQPRLWMMNDTDGDDRADTQRELLRGIDVTDSHHGGMIASDPLGAVIFSDGVFHRSQLETPFGVHRGMDATTYRLDMRTGSIVTEWQHTTPNPWNVTFDRWGNIFQMYGDGDVYDGSALTWTPLGAYQPYAYGRITSYGKGSGNAMITGDNFPDEFENGFASASLLGRYAVTLSKLNRDAGMVKLADSLTILESPNAAFRPADVEFAMDGSLYVSDFCSPIIGHAQHPMRDPHWDHDYGRIWRIVHTEKPLSEERPKIEGTAPKALCELLTHSHDLVRHHTRIELRKHGAEGLKAVDQWIAAFDRDDAAFDQAALEAIFVCEGLGETRPALIDHLLQSDSAMFRGAAVHVIRIQADRFPDVAELLTSVVNDPHPRVQVEVVDAVAHLRPTFPEIESVLATLTSEDATVNKSLAYLDYGVEPVKGRSVPVLEVAPESQLTQWLWLGEEGENAPAEYQVGKGNIPSSGLFRSFVYSDDPQPAILAINHKNLEVRLNDTMVFSQDSYWSGDQQVNVELAAGLNVVEIFLKKARRPAKTMPPVFLYDPVGQALDGARYLSDSKSLQAATAEYDQFIAERGNVIHVQAAAGLQFAPTQLSVTPGSKVRLVFENPDIMMHNWVLLKPGSVNEVGALADEMAAQEDAMERGYLPESDKILHATKLLGPKAREELVFDAPAELGEYPYICTFPGHWRIMQGVLTVAERKRSKVAPAAEPKSGIVITKKIGEGVVFETASHAASFKKLVPPEKPAGKVTANKKTNNDPLVSLTDGKLAKGFGPIFGNGIKDGAYKMDLGSSQSVSAITSWSYNQNGKRGSQSVSIYGSNDPADPGWNLTDAKRFTSLGKISTEGQKVDAFTALSLRAKKAKLLGDFRWIVWQTAPVTSIDENTAFQELSVETVAPPAEKPAPAKKEASARAGGKPKAAPPNVVLIMTDDQGYGDLACHGNPIVKTPNIDQLYAESIRFTDFHVSSFCTPSRAALMTGRHPGRTGAYRTSSGRTMLHTDEKTIADVFSQGGYGTGMVGKWHLGDNAPHRPQDRGFQDVVWHRCGGVGQASDFWGNDYFDDTYERNGSFEKFDGYCTDVWFAESMRFVEENKERPFFLYLAPNAPHGPYRVDRKWSDPYRKDVPWGGGPEFYGMVENIDHNVGLLRAKLEELGLTENTIFIYMTDNGTANGAKFEGLTSEAKQGYNAGMRGKKSSIYEGGHRVPFFIHWPKGKLTGGRDVESTAAHIDVLPTLAELCGIPVPKSHHPDGVSFASLLKDPKAAPHRDHHIIQYQGGPHFKGAPAMWEYSCVLKGDWRLIDGKELYDLGNDPGQKDDVAADHPAVVAELRALYPPFWESVSPRMTPVAIDLGNPSDNPTVLCSQDWYMETGNPPWNFGSIKKLPKVTGPWHVDVKTSGRYQITLRQFPVEADKPVVAERAKIEIAGQTAEAPVEAGSKGVVFELDLPAGLSELHTWLYDKNGNAGGAYFTEVEAL